MKKWRGCDSLRFSGRGGGGIVDFVTLGRKSLKWPPLPGSICQ